MLFGQSHISSLLHEWERVSTVPVPIHAYLFYRPFTKQEHTFLVVRDASEHPCATDGLPLAVGVVQVYLLLSQGHEEELPTKLSKEAPDSKEPGRPTVFPVNHLGDAPAKMFHPAAFGVPALLGVCSDKEPFSPSAVAA
jgi:hypothetical protein